MMLLALSLVLSSAIAQQAPGAWDIPPERVQAVAIRATGSATEQPAIAAELKGMEEFLKTLPYAEYTIIAENVVETPIGTEAGIPLGDRLTLYVKPEGQSEEGAVQLSAHLELNEDGHPVDALIAQGSAARGKPLVFRGVPNGMNGEDIVVFKLLQPENPDSQPQGSEEQQQEPRDEEQEAEQEEEKGGQEQPQEEQEPPQETQAEQQQNAEAAQDQEPSKDLENIEAILRSLEEVDRQEQKNAHNRRTSVEIKGDWW